ncbi:MAG: lipoyl(octanoyl) transferase LipB [Phycisphaerales bacterium]|nr:MAG: lipoyl(octanoyl) transferase LipB [Phycisphaerales bacterium]
MDSSSPPHAAAKQTANQPLEIRDCGLADYRQILHLQQQLCEKRRQGEIPDTALIVEHPSVITFGARQSRNKLLVNQQALQQRKINLVRIRRGGGVTAHNPGQLVLYPILHLQQAGLGINEYIRELEAVGAALLEQFGLNSSRREGSPGLWVGDRKIASIGVRVSRMTTYHGMAINIQNDLSIFELIIPCGLDGVEMTSVLKETGERHAMNDVKECLASVLRRRFSASMRQ